MEGSPVIFFLQRACSPILRFVSTQTIFLRAVSKSKKVIFLINCWSEVTTCQVYRISMRFCFIFSIPSTQTADRDLQFVEYCYLYLIIIYFIYKFNKHTITLMIVTKYHSVKIFSIYFGIYLNKF